MKRRCICSPHCGTVCDQMSDVNVPLHIIYSGLWVHVCVPTPCLQQFLHWMMPFGLTKLEELAHHLPHNIIAREQVILVRAIKPKTLSNQSAGLLRSTQFCDLFNVPKTMCMPTPE